MRKNIYMEFGRKLVEIGGAYYCFCSKERITSIREVQEKSGADQKYDRYCLKLNSEDIRERLAAGEPFVIRQKMPDSGTTSFEDRVYGRITVENSTLEDQVLIKSDGMPTYNFANVIDDHLMKITHVVRGNEYLSSAPKYNLLYNAFGWQIPEYIHVPLIIRPDGHKLSKREGDPTFEDLLAMGFIAETVVNFVVLLGWSPGSTQEIFSLKQLEDNFNIEGISKSPAVFDINKLKWMNGEYLRKMSAEEFHQLVLPYYEGVIANAAFDLKKVSKLLQVRTELLSDIAQNIDFLNTVKDYDIGMYTNSKMKTTPQSSVFNLEAAYKILTDLSVWDAQALHNTLIQLAANMSVKNGQLLWPLRIALSGKEVTPGGAIEIAEIIGKDKTLARIRKAIDKINLSLS